MLRFVFINAEDATRVIGFRSKEPLTLRMLELVKPGDVVLDVGASMGIYAIPAGVKVQETGYVIAVEPDGDKVKKLARNVEINGLSDRIGIENLFAGDASTSGTAGKKLDDLLQLRSYPSPTIIKIDVDGPELSVLKGLRMTLQTNQHLRLIQVEFTDLNAELIDYLWNFGWRLVAFETHASRDRDLFRGEPVIGNGWFVRRGETQP